MEAKKSPKANIEKSRGSFFMIGLCVASSFALMAFEWSSAHIKGSDLKSEVIENDEVFALPEELIVLKNEVAQPKPANVKKVSKEFLEVTDKLDKVVEEEDLKEEEAEETFDEMIKKIGAVDESINRDEDNLILEPIEDNTEYGTSDENVLVPYYEYCKDFNRKEKIKCISSEVHKIIAKQMSNISSDQIAQNKSNKMYVQFVINKSGLIENVKIGKENHYEKGIVKMVKKSLSKVPSMMPATINGKPVKILFTLPIAFTVE